MTTEYIRYRLKDHSAQELIDSYAAASEFLMAAPECLGYALKHCEEDPTQFILHIDWVSTEAHLNGFRKGSHFPPFLSAIRPFIGEIEEMQHYAPTSVAWQRTAP